MSDNCIRAADASQRLGPLTGIPDLLADFGRGTEEVVAGLGIATGVFDDPDNRVPFALAGRLIKRCVDVTACPHVGLILGSRHDHRSLGLAGKVMRNSPDLGSALSNFCALQDANSRGAAVYLRRAGDVFVFGYGIYDPAAVAHEQVYSLALAMGVNIVHALTEGAVEPVETLLSSRRPADVEPYQSILKSPVRFDQQETGIVLHRASMAAPIPGASSQELARLRERIALLSPASDHVWTDRVKHAVRPLLLEGEATTASMARLLNLNVRTLSRRLETEGTTFQRILEGVRYSIARELLEVTLLPIGDIAGALAYTEHSSFSDAFRRWSGVTPSEWREKSRVSEIAR